MTKDDARKIGVFGASAIVAGNMMGSGIALLPSNLAKIGSVSIIACAFCLVVFSGATRAYLAAVVIVMPGGVHLLCGEGSNGVQMQDG